jgi:hypothetical protein
VPVAHTCNRSYSGGRDQKDYSRSQPRQIVHETLSQIKPSQKRAGGVAQGVPQGQAPGPQKKKRKKEKIEGLSNGSL